MTGPTTDPTTPAPELTALGDDELVARYELVRDEMGVMTGPAFVSAQANYKDLRAELKRRLAAAERPAEGTVVISANDARFIDSFMCSELHLHPEWDATYRAEVDAVWRRVMSVVDALAASSAPADAALGQGEGTEGTE